MTAFNMIFIPVCLGFVLLTIPFTFMWLHAAGLNSKAADAYRAGDIARGDRIRARADAWSWFPDHTAGVLFDRIERIVKR